MEHIKRVMHGESKTRLYRIWSNLKNRVLPNSVKAKYYFDRGIGLCDEWKNSFISFRDWSINNGYDDKLTIDRIDNNLGYSPENCRWVDMKTQANNRSNNITVYADKTCVPFSDVCRILGVDYNTAYGKIIMNLVANKNVENIGKVEQKPAEWHREDEQNLNACLGYIPDEFLRRWLQDAIYAEYENPAWSEEDVSKIDTIIGYIASSAGEKLGTLLPCINWLKSIKDRVQPRSKQEWSEEDENRIDNLCHFLEEYGNQFYGHLTLQGTISWLKSLRPQNKWKPSDEQIKVCKFDKV